VFLGVPANLRTSSGDCAARPTLVPSPRVGPPRPGRGPVRRPRQWRRHRPSHATKPGTAGPPRGGSRQRDGAPGPGVIQHARSRGPRFCQHTPIDRLVAPRRAPAPRHADARGRALETF
jgi:hypothetical protein